MGPFGVEPEPKRPAGTIDRYTAMWIDSHCHLDAPEFGADHALALSLRERAAALGVGLCVIPAVERSNFDTVRQLAHRTGDAYALGIHPLYVPQARETDLDALDAALTEHPSVSRAELMVQFDDWVTDPAIRLTDVNAFIADNGEFMVSMCQINQHTISFCCFIHVQFSKIFGGFFIRIACAMFIYSNSNFSGSCSFCIGNCICYSFLFNI